MNIINKTNRQLKIKQINTEEYLILEASDNPITTNAFEEASQIDNIEIRTDTTTLVNVPEKIEGTIYVVEKNIKMYLLDRDDIYYPSRDIVDSEKTYLYNEFLMNIIV